MAAGLAVALAVAGVVAALIVLRSPVGHQAAAGARDSRHTAGSAAGTATATPSAQPPVRQAAGALSALLANSVRERRSVVSAVGDVSRCGPGLNQDARAFTAAAASRQHLLTQLSALPHRSALSPAMLSALTRGWRASAQADRDFARWARDEAGGCIRNDHADAGYRAAAGPDELATAEKKIFVRRWNPVASRYGLPAYQWDQL